MLVMERAAGSLRDLIDAGMPETDRGRLIAGICEGLAHLHRSGWVHADLKPENVLLGRDGSVKLSDFGLATELTGTHGYAPPMGTMDYFPPERWKAPLGELGVPIRPTADIWALGVIIHEVFAPGVPVFAGATPWPGAPRSRSTARGVRRCAWILPFRRSGARWPPTVWHRPIRPAPATRRRACSPG